MRVTRATLSEMSVWSATARRGRTSLTAAILFDTAAVNRLGRVEDGNR